MVIDKQKHSCQHVKLDLAYLPIKELNSVKSVSKNKKEESGERYTYIHMKKNRTGIVCISDTKLIGHAERIFCFAVRISCEKGGKKGGLQIVRTGVHPHYEPNEFLFLVLSTCVGFFLNF